MMLSAHRSQHQRGYRRQGQPIQDEPERGLLDRWCRVLDDNLRETDKYRNDD